MCFAGFIWCGDKSWIDKYVINHENIHLRQQIEMLFIPFYLEYVIEWIYQSIKYRDTYKGYKNISHEREAYLNERNLNYLETRKPFAQFRKTN